MTEQADLSVPVKRKPGRPRKDSGVGPGLGAFVNSHTPKPKPIEGVPVDLSQVPEELKPYQPFGSIIKVFYAKDDEVIVDGPAGTGKSRGILEKLNLVAMKYPKARILVVRKTRTSLTQSAMVTYEQNVMPASIVQWRTTEQEYRYVNGSRIVIGGMDKASRVLSTDFDLIYIQEGTELTEDEYETLITRARNGIVPYNQVIVDCNPSRANHWLKRRFDEGKALRIKSRHEDNPRLYDHLADEWTQFGRTYLAKLQNLSGHRYKRLYLGEWVSSEGIIYEGWNPDIHLIYRFEIPKTWRKFLVVDFGYKNPFVAQWWAIDEDGNLYRYREIYHTQRTVRVHAEDIKRLSGDEYLESIICDHDASDRATLEENGLPSVPARKAVSPGIQAVQEALKTKGNGRPGIFFLRDSLVEVDQDLLDAMKPTRTEEEFESYIWEDNAKKDQPVKMDDHGMDATRYAVMHATYSSSTGGIFL